MDFVTVNDERCVLRDAHPVVYSLRWNSAATVSKTVRGRAAPKEMDEDLSRHENRRYIPP